MFSFDSIFKLRYIIFGGNGMIVDITGVIISLLPLPRPYHSKLVMLSFDCVFKLPYTDFLEVAEKNDRGCGWGNFFLFGLIFQIIY